MKFGFIFIGAFVAITTFLYGFIRFDLYMNPWIEQVVNQWHWYHYITSFHALTALYLKGNDWIIISAMISFIATCVATWQFIRAE